MVDVKFRHPLVNFSQSEQFAHAGVSTSGAVEVLVTMLLGGGLMLVTLKNPMIV